MLGGPGAQIKGARVRFSSSHCTLIFRIAGVGRYWCVRSVAATLNLHRRVVCRSPRRDMSTCGTSASCIAREARSLGIPSSDKLVASRDQVAEVLRSPFSAMRRKITPSWRSARTRIREVCISFSTSCDWRKYACAATA
jgi:hypothetical protein